MNELPLVVDISTRLSDIAEHYFSLDSDELSKSNYFVIVNDNVYAGKGSANELM